jgi:hypothetical protein
MFMLLKRPGCFKARHVARWNLHLFPGPRINPGAGLLVEDQEGPKIGNADGSVQAEQARGLMPLGSELTSADPCCRDLRHGIPVWAVLRLPSGYGRPVPWSPVP